MKITNRQFRKLLKETHPRASVDNLLFDYDEYVRSEGHVTPAASSVIASFFLTLPDGVGDHEAHEILATEYGIDHQDIMRDIDRQQAEVASSVSQEALSSEEEDKIRKSALGSMAKNPPHTPWKKPALGESKKMRMTKRQLRRLIEETQKTLQEDHVDTELDHLQKNVHDDIEHIRDLKDDIHDDHDEELRAEKEKKDESIHRILRKAARRLFELNR
jgi:hypothetical protein